MRGPKDSRLLSEQRRRKILDLIEQKSQITVRDLVEKFSISAVTARADLDALSSQGMVVRSHGGAVRQVEASQEYPLRLKKTLHHAEKARIGRAAAELIQNNETVILDSGTTTAEIARHLKARRLQSVTVITHALNVAYELIDAPDISVIMIGGLLRPVSCSFVGPQAEAMLKEFHADRLFLRSTDSTWKSAHPLPTCGSPTERPHGEHLEGTQRRCRLQQVRPQKRLPHMPSVESSPTDHRQPGAS